MANLSGFDASTVPEGDALGAVPEGQYVVIATASEMKPTKKGDGEYLQFVFEILDGQYKGRKIWSRMNLNNLNATAVEIAQRELAQLCKAVGVIRPQDSSELHNKPILATVALEKDDRNRESNVIKKYEAIDAPAGGIMQAAAAQGAINQQQPAFQQQAPAQQQQAAPAAAKKPWEK